MTLDEKVQIPDKLRGGTNAAAVSLTLRRYIILKSNFSMINLL
jgi:hypothetical protein